MTRDELEEDRTTLFTSRELLAALPTPIHERPGLVRARPDPDARLPFGSTLSRIPLRVRVREGVEPLRDRVLLDVDGARGAGLAVLPEWEREELLRHVAFHLGG